MKKFLVIDVSIEQATDCGFVTAESEAQALEKYSEAVAPTNEKFQEKAYSRSLKDGYGEKFFLQTDDERFAFIVGGQVTADTNTVVERVRSFFGEHTLFADLYIAHYFSSRNLSETLSEDALEQKSIEFPAAMLVYMWKNTDYPQMVAIPVDDIAYIA